MRRSLPIPPLSHLRFLGRILLVIVAFLLFAPISSYAMSAPTTGEGEKAAAYTPRLATFTYENTAAGTPTADGCAADTNLNRLFTVTDAFTVDDLNVGFIATNVTRGEIRATLQSPAGTRVQIIRTTADTFDHYDVLLDSASANPLNDGSNDNVAAPFYDRTAAPSFSLDAFNGESAQGIWTLEVCDTVAANATAFVRAQLVFEGTPPGIIGTAYRDFNYNGVRDGGETGLAGVTVTAFDSDNTVVATVVTGAAGTYNLPLTGEVRLEFTGQPAAIFAGTAGASTVQFVNAPKSNVDVGFASPGTYCQSSPDLCTTLYTSGDPLPTGGGTAGNSPSVITVPYGATGDGQNQLGATARSIGSVWGLTYQRSTDRLFSAAFVKRHVGLGTQAAGGIYTVTDPAGTSTAANFINLAGPPYNIAVGTIGTNAVRGLPTNPSSPSYDTTAFDAVGKVGLGDLEISSDERTLYVVNLNTRQPIAIVIDADNNPATPPAAADVTVMAAPVLSPACTNGVFRPFALKFNEGFLYMGGICDAGSASGTSANLEAIVFRYNPATPATAPTQILRFSLNYNKGLVISSDAAPACQDGAEDRNWQPWRATFPAGCSPSGRTIIYPQPMLSSIEFDTDGSMIMDFMDRSGHQIGYLNYSLNTASTTTYVNMTGGELLRAYPNAAGTGYVMENNAATNRIATSGTSNGQGIGGGEYYYGDFFSGVDGSGIVSHNEVAQGGMVLLPGRREIVTTGFDPVTNVNAGGLLWLSNNTGRKLRGYEIYLTSSAPGTFAKANGTSDLVALCTAAPIEIGNRIWRDSNGNGIQDADESHLSGVTVQLYSGATLVGTVITDIEGDYLFSSDPTRTDVVGADYGIAAITPGASLQIRILPTAGQNVNALNGMYLTTVDVNSGANSDLRDSDATLVGGNAVIPVTIGVIGQNNHTYDIGYAPLGSIGNRLWLDEDSNGYEDEGEPGIANITVQLKNSSGVVIATTFTDPNGDYIFKNLPAGTYFVQVLSSTLLTGLSQTTTFPVPNGDNGNQNQSGQGYQIVLSAGQQNLTADFGYNWNPTSDVIGNTGTVAIGNLVWVDANGDGQRQFEEIGISGITLELLTAGPDNIFGTADDVVAGTATTDVNGYYIFDGYPSGAYMIRVTNPPAGYTQTGDPDHFNTPVGVNDNQTTFPVIMAPGDVYLDVDFGYQPNVGTFGSIGNTIWLDFDADGCGPNNVNSDTGNGNCTTGDNTELPIPNVTVVLIRDLNNNQVYDVGEPILAVDVTDDRGQYLFPGLPIADGIGTDDYLVLVNDAYMTLRGLAPTYDANGIASPNISAAPNISATPVTNQDFGYTFDNSGLSGAQTTTLPMPAAIVLPGQIGDRVWLDVNNNGVQDTNEPGIANVRVNLLCNGLDGLPNTADDVPETGLTGPNGIYLFINLPVSAAGNVCRVTIDTSTLPGNVTQTFDSDGTGTPHTSIVTLTTTTPTSFSQDFGYRGLGTVGNLVWRDTNANGISEGANGPDGLPNTDDDEPGISQVTMGLWYDRNGNGLIDIGDIPMGTATTDNNGAYLFGGLPTNDGGNNAQYIVDVTDQSSRLAGFAHSRGTLGTNNHSQPDPYPVTITPAAPNNLTADFGYHYEGAALGNRVWLDLNANGIQDAADPGIAGVVVNLTIAYPNGAATIVLTAVTNGSGYYTFRNLLQDEQFNGTGPNGPVYTISVGGNQVGLSGLSSTIIDVSGNTQDLVDSDNPAGVVATPIEGQNNVPLVPTLASAERAIASYDFGYVRSGAIGNRIWLDENSNGVQDQGEDGMANITVNLYNSAGAVVATTITNANGEYLFKNLPPATYFVRVDESTLATGLSQTTIFPGSGTDLVNQNQATGPGVFGYQVTLASGQINLTADFGYNWNPTADVRTPGATTTAALGDRVWADTNGNGRQDPIELGIPGAILQIVTAGPDNIFGSADDVLGATATTDAMGYYIFDNLPPGAYIVQVNSLPAAFAGYIQTGDPDHFGITGANDARTTTPIILGPGDVHVNVDFGYQPPAAAVGSIGDTIWLDVNANAIGPANTPGGGDTTEPYIPGVTVSLIRDLNNNGARDAGEPFIASMVTNANGQYLFTGLPIIDGTGTDDYLVLVDDTTGRLIGLSQTYDANGLATPNISSVLNLAPAAVLTQDFGYTYDASGLAGTNGPTAPLIGVAEQPGRIGDRVWLDLNSNGVQDANEPGLIGVTVQLTSVGPDGTSGTADDISQSVVTGPNGAYLFDNLPVSVAGIPYVITVLPATLPGTLTQTFDATPPTNNNSSTVSLTTAVPVNLGQDFGYVGTGTVGNFIWNDTNGDGDFDAGEPGIGGVTVAIYWDSNGNSQLDPADRLINTATTDANGAYLFTGLSVNNTRYIVDVTDLNGALVGYNHTVGTPNTNNNSQRDNGYPVLLTAGAPNNLTADFGYQLQVAALGNRVWLDLNNNGLQDTGDPGIAGVIVTMQITYPGGGVVTIATTTNASGYYSFQNLLSDEDYRGDGAAGEPVYVISVGAAQVYLGGLANTIIDVAGNSQDLRDSDNPAGVTAIAIEGLSNVPMSFTDPVTEPVVASYDFGYVRTGAIGNRIWLDEDSNGVQDQGENGIPNVTVNLYNSAGTIVATTTTNTNGEYLFRNLPPATYFVRVDETTLATGLSQTTIFPAAGADLVNQNQATGPGVFGYQITLASGQLNLSGDFGYNWNPTSEVRTPGATNTAALGDRVWADTNGNGRQDPEEVGIQGAILQIVTAGPDNVFATPDDVLGATATTDANGYYIFDNLPPGAYVVQVNSIPAAYAGSPQTGDPDHFGTTGPNDARTTVPVILAPGDVFLNVDFGYQPAAGIIGSIGDTIWLDVNANSIGPANTPGGGDTTEPGIPGVTVSLIRDLNNNGARDAGEPIIATTITNASGQYLFTGLPIIDGTGTDDYLVLVDDIAGRLLGLAQTFDFNGLATPNISSVLNLGPAAVLTQDFGYTYDASGLAGTNGPTRTLLGAVEQPGRIGDRVWLDLNSNGVQDANEPGLIGVTVQLTSVGPDGTSGTADDINQLVVTGANGAYLFDNLPVSAAGIPYTIAVLPATLPGTLTQTFDATPPTNNNSSTVSLTTAVPVNLGQDFGYVGTGTVGNFIWLDSNGDGVVSAGETGIAGVTVAIYWDSNANGQLDPADRFINVATTNASGLYQFTGLSLNDGNNDIQYLVDVTDLFGVLAGYSHTVGTVGANDNSQTEDGYPVLLTTTVTSNQTADFGYQQQGAAVGNRVFNDDNNNGLQDTNEPGISGIRVDMRITYPNGAVTNLTTITNGDGYYSFGNLLQDENYNGIGAGQPVYVLSVNTAQPNLSGYLLAIVDVNGNSQDLQDSDNHSGVTAVAIEGQVTIPLVPTNPVSEGTIASYDFGFVSQLDYGDLPIGYNNIRLANNGARHVLGPVRLGVLVDSDGEGAPTPLSNGDDVLDLSDDEDGVIKTPGSIWTAGGTGMLDVTVSGGTGFVTVWIDWNRNNSFSDPGERVFVDQSIANSTQTITFPIPAGTTFPPGQVTNVRARLYSATTGGAASPLGLAAGTGEVEDHQLDSSSLSVVLEAFAAQCRTETEDVLVTWVTATETDVLGFNIQRGVDDTAPDTQVNPDLIPSAVPGGGQGAEYEYADTTVEAGAYFYWLEAVQLDGSTEMYGPVSVQYPCTPTAVTVIGFGATPTPPAWGTGFVLMMLAGAGIVVLKRR